MQALFFGLGYSSSRTADMMAETGTYARLYGTRRSLAASGPAIPLVFDGTAPGPEVGKTLRNGITHVILSVAPDADGDLVLRHHRADLDAAQDLQWLCYFSTVGVYGDFGGDWIDETAPLSPKNARSAWRVKAEDQWRTFAAARGVPLCIFRLAGIYGPGRSGFDKLRDGTARRIIKQGQVFNRIHVDDIARVTMLAAQQRLAGTFNLADDLPAPPQDVVEHAADLIGAPVPPDMPFETADLSPMARSFYADNKRVSNAAIKSALGIELLYPNYRAGLAAILKDEQ